jgi:hypothetical protein
MPSVFGLGILSFAVSNGFQIQFTFTMTLDLHKKIMNINTGITFKNGTCPLLTYFPFYMKVDCHVEVF